VQSFDLPPEEQERLRSLVRDRSCSPTSPLRNKSPSGTIEEACYSDYHIS
jgi:hypothetical protein